MVSKSVKNYTPASYSEICFTQAFSVGNKDCKMIEAGHVHARINGSFVLNQFKYRIKLSSQFCHFRAFKRIYFSDCKSLTMSVKSATPGTEADAFPGIPLSNFSPPGYAYKFTLD